MAKWKFVVRNKSEYRSRHVTAILRRILKSVPHKLTPRTIQVNILSTKGSMTLRYGSNPPCLDIRLTDDGSFDKKLLCCYIAWCLARLQGFKGRDLSGSGYYDQRTMVTVNNGGTWTTTGQPKYAQVYAWADQMPLDKKATKAKLTGAALAFKKAEEAQEKVNEWESKVKKANTILKKWRRKLKYHEERASRLQLEWAKNLQQGGQQQ